jgi:ABC-type polysaccharide/polyol phosphate export permease
MQRPELLSFGLLVKGCLRRNLLNAPVAVLGKQIVLPAAIVGFVSFLGTGAAVSQRWPVFAIALVVWLLFANSVSYGGMVLWHERWLLRQRVIPAWLLLAAAALGPIGIFAVHLSLLHIGVVATSFPRTGFKIETLVAGGIAAATGLGTGIFAARLVEYRPHFASVLPKLLLATLVLTPVFYRLSALDGLKDIWCLANPLCVATELGRAGISFQADTLPRQALPIAAALSAAILCWGLFTLRLPANSFPEEHA